MPDMLVKLYELPELHPLLDKLERQGIVVRRAYPYELTPVRQFVARHFSQGWADELTGGFARQPVSVFLAQEGDRCVGFAGYECTTRDYFGPEGVLEEYRGRGLGKALLLCCLHALREMGYAYAIIGAAGPVEFYTQACGAIPIEGSTPGFYCHQRLQAEETPDE